MLRGLASKPIRELAEKVDLLVKQFGQMEVWFVTGSQGLYGEDTLKLVAQDSQWIADGLSMSDRIPVRVVYKPVVTTPDAIAKVCLDANSDQNCIGLIT